MTSDEALPIAESIAAGHAFEKHVVQGKEFADSEALRNRLDALASELRFGSLPQSA